MIYVKEFLVKELKRGQVVVMDNINFHKNADVMEELCKKLAVKNL